MIEPNPELSIRRQCELLRVSRSGLSYEPEATSAEELALMKRIDELHLAFPFYGSRKLLQALRTAGREINRKRVQRLMRLMDNAVLPNQFRSKVKECFVVGAGYGDVSSERAYIRTESLSCITRDGTAIDVPIKGYVAGEDGKAGRKPGRKAGHKGGEWPASPERPMWAAYSSSSWDLLSCLARRSSRG